MYWKIVLPILLLVAPAMAHDDGRYAGSPLHEWFDSLGHLDSTPLWSGLGPVRELLSSRRAATMLS